MCAMHKNNCSVILIFILLSITTWLINRNGDVSSAISPKHDNRNMQKYLHKMYQQEVDIYKNWSVQEVEDIRASVRSMIEEIVYRAFRDQELLHIPRDKVSNHLRAKGSVDEGTKIRSPDEFDFQMIFPHFTSSNIAIMWDNVNDNCAKLKYLNESQEYPLNSPFRKIISNDKLTTNIVTMFQELATPVLKTMYDNKFHIVLDSGTLYIVKKVKYRYACVTFYFRWKSTINSRGPLTISVDCVPSINLSSRDIFKKVHTVSNKLSSILGLDDNILSQPSQETFTIGDQNETYQFCLTFLKTQTGFMRVLTRKRQDIVECFKLVKSFNPHKSPISSTDIKSLLIYEVLPHMKFSKDNMSLCVFRLVETLLKLIQSKTCGQVLLPDLLFGYTYPRRLFKCYKDTQLYNVSQIFATVYSHLKGLDLPV